MLRARACLRPAPGAPARPTHACAGVHTHTLPSSLSQESKDLYQREKQLQREREAQFLNDFKRAILLDGGYVQRLGPEVSSRVGLRACLPSAGGCREAVVLPLAHPPPPRASARVLSSASARASGSGVCSMRTCVQYARTRGRAQHRPVCMRVCARACAPSLSMSACALAACGRAGRDCDADGEWREGAAHRQAKHRRWWGQLSPQGHESVSRYLVRGRGVCGGGLGGRVAVGSTPPPFFSLHHAIFTRPRKDAL